MYVCVRTNRTFIPWCRPPGLLFRVVNNKNKLYKILNKRKLKYIDITKKKKKKQQKAKYINFYNYFL